jgi:hypothetical protein
MMHVSANEKAVSLNVHRYTAGALTSVTGVAVGLALFTTLFCSKKCMPDLSGLYRGWRQQTASHSH